MLILGIETATAAGRLRHRRPRGRAGLVPRRPGPAPRRDARRPPIEFVCRQARVELAEIGAVAVDIGPGSSPACGSASPRPRRMAHGAAGADDRRVEPRPARVPGAAHRAGSSSPVIDARRGEVFYAFYRQVPGGVQRLSPYHGRHARRPRVGAAGHGRGVPARRRRRPALRRGASTDLAQRRVRPTPACAYPSAAVARASWPTPGRCARSSCSRGSSSRSTCASPTPRSTGTTAGAARWPPAATTDARRTLDGAARADAPPPPPLGAAHRGAGVPAAVVARACSCASWRCRDTPAYYVAPRRAARSSATPG